MRRGLIYPRNAQRATGGLINLNEGAAQAYFAAGYRKR
jgi:hypothetical protein